MRTRIDQLLFSLSLFIFSNESQVWAAIPAGEKLIVPDGQDNDAFGTSVAIDGDTALLGSLRHKNTGAVSVFSRGKNGWTEITKLLSGDPDRFDNFGISVAIEGDLAVVGASGDDQLAINAGAAYIFVRQGDTWIQDAKLFADDPNRGDSFGKSVAISGNTVLIGADSTGDLGQFSGSAYVFVRDGNEWLQQAKLLASDGSVGDLFGRSVALEGDTALVGAFEKNEDFFTIDVGATYVFMRDGETWSEQQILTASDGAEGDSFGISVAFNQGTAVIGAFRSDTVATNSGSAYIFVHNGSSWVEETKLVASDGEEQDQFGNAVAIQNGMVVVGASQDDDLGSASGSSYVFTRDQAGSWGERFKLLATDGGPNDRLGSSVATDGVRGIVGSTGAEVNHLNPGTAYISRLVLPR